MTYSGMTHYNTYPVDESTRVVVYYDDDYEMQAEERELTDEQIEEEQRILDTDGVYVVTVEKLLRWVLLGVPETVTRVEWEQVEAIHGCFLDADYTAVQVARDHFPEHFNN